MSNNNFSEQKTIKKKFVEYVRTNSAGKSELVTGYFKDVFLMPNSGVIQVNTGSNILTLPPHKWNLIKEPQDE